MKENIAKLIMELEQSKKRTNDALVRVSELEFLLEVERSNDAKEAAEKERNIVDKVISKLAQQQVIEEMKRTRRPRPAYRAAKPTPLTPPVSIYGILKRMQMPGATISLRTSPDASTMRQIFLHVHPDKLSEEEKENMPYHFQKTKEIYDLTIERDKKMDGHQKQEMTWHLNTLWSNDVYEWTEYEQYVQRGGYHEAMRRWELARERFQRDLREWQTIKPSQYDIDRQQRILYEFYGSEE